MRIYGDCYEGIDKGIHFEWNPDIAIQLLSIPLTLPQAEMLRDRIARGTIIDLPQTSITSIAP